jgi:hypothetical protein
MRCRRIVDAMRNGCVVGIVTNAATFFAAEIRQLDGHQASSRKLKKAVNRLLMNSLYSEGATS